MDFSLSSSLVGSAVSNPDGLALDLQFATDKTLTARKGPTPAFTRASSATVVGSAGLVRYAPNNAALYSGQLVVGTGWGANATPSVTSIVDGLGPDGNNAYEIAEIANTGTHVLFNSGGSGTTGATSVVSGTTYAGSIFIKKAAGSVNWIQLTFGAAGFGSTQYANFNISNGTIGNFSATTPQIQDAGGGWYRCSVSSAATATIATSNLALAFTDNTNTVSRVMSYAGNTANKVLAAMCQFEIGSTVNTYNPTTTAAFQGPRFDHDPVTLACKGLLIEESRTNNVFNSNLLTTDSWPLTGATIATSDTAPDGSSAFEITETLAVSNHSIANTGGATSTPATSITSGVIYTLSVFAKKSTGSIDWIQLTGTGVQFGTAQYANFNLATGAIGNYTGVTSGTVPKMEQFSNGWWRCSITLTATATGTGNAVPLNFTNNTNTTTRGPSYLGSTANKVKLAMAQFEAGAFPTSYIPTTTSSVIRSADVCSISGSDFSGFYNPLEGSLFTSVIFNTPVTNAAAQVLVDINDTTTANRLRYLRNVANAFPRMLNTSNLLTNVDIIGTVALNPFITQKFSAGFKLNDYVFNVNNSQIGTDNLGVLPISPTTLTIGAASSGVSPLVSLNGTIGSLRYYKKRLPNEKLQALTV